MNGKECRDGINIRVSAQAMEIVLLCAGAGVPKLVNGENAEMTAFVLGEINSVMEAVQEALMASLANLGADVEKIKNDAEAYAETVLDPANIPGEVQKMAEEKLQARAAAEKETDNDEQKGD